MSTSNRAYWVLRQGEGELLPVETGPASLPRSRSRVQALFTGVSAGTERLIALGRVPAGCEQAMACRYMGGHFRLPIKYGYSYVAQAVSGELSGQRVFVMHPHQEQAEIADEHATVLPEELPSARATLIPNLETALNAVWDAELRPGESVVVIGAGAVGLLVAYVASRLHGVGVTVAEPDGERNTLASSLSWIERVVAPADLEPGASNVAFHASGSSSGLQTAVDAVGFEGRVIELSWYGDERVQLDLGSHFHYQRKRIQASQVSAIAPSKRDAFGFPERLAEVLSLLDEPELDRLLGSPVPFDEMPELMARVYRGSVIAPLPLIEYGAR